MASSRSACSRSATPAELDGDLLTIAVIIWVAVERRVRRDGDDGTDLYGALLPLNEPDPLFALALQQGALLDRRRHARRLLAAAVPARARLLRRGLPRRPGAGDERTRRSPTSGTSSRAACSRSTSAGPGTSASSGVACRAERQGDWATAPLPGPDGPGVSTAGGSSLVIFRSSRAQGGGVEADRVPQRAGDDAALSRPHRRPAAAAQRLARTGARRRSRRRRRSASNSSACAPRRRSPNGSASSRRCSSPPNASCSGRQGAEAADGSSTPGSTPCSRSAAGCARAQAGDGRETRAGVVGWALAAPALLVIAVFFALPVVDGPGAQPDRLRPLRARRPLDLALRRPATTTCACCRRRCSGRRSATRSTSSSSACRCRSACRSARPCCSNARVARWQAFFRTSLFAPVVTTRRRGRGHLALPAAHALRADQPGAGGDRHRRRSTGSATRTGRCRRSSCSPPGRTSATTW